MWTFMKENKSEWAGGAGWGGPDPHPAGPRAPAEPHFAARALPRAMPSLGLQWTRQPCSWGPTGVVGQSGGRIHAH